MKRRGFTLVELLVVMSIIGILAAVLLSSVSNSRTKARISRATSDLTLLKKSSEALAADTELHLFGYRSNCTAGPAGPPALPGNDTNIERAISNTATDLGLISKGNFPAAWNGPYIDSVPNDPWGRNYWVDPDYMCAATVGPNDAACNGKTSGVVMALVSYGVEAKFTGNRPNSEDNDRGPGKFGDDNITVLLCNLP